MQGAWRAWRSGWSGWWSGAGQEVRELARDEVLRLPRRRAGFRIQVQEGTLVVTREGDPEDHVLEAGAALELTGPGLTLAWALEPSRVEVIGRAGRAAERTGAPRPFSLAR